MSSNGVSAASNLTGIISFSITLIGFIAVYRRLKPSTQLKAFRELLHEAEVTYQSLCEENFLPDARLKDEINGSLHKYLYLLIKLFTIKLISLSLSSLRLRYFMFCRSVHEQSSWIKRFFTLSRDIARARKEVKRLQSHILKSARDNAELGDASTGVDRYHDASNERTPAGAVTTMDIPSVVHESLPPEIRTHGLSSPHPATTISSPNRAVTINAVTGINSIPVPTSPPISHISPPHTPTRYAAMAISGNNNMPFAYSTGANSPEGAPQRYPLATPARADYRTHKGRRYYRSSLRDLAKIRNVELDIQWSENQSGEAHAPTWTATAIVRGHRPISFSAKTKDGAQEACAKKLLEDLGWL